MLLAFFCCCEKKVKMVEIGKKCRKIFSFLFVEIMVSRNSRNELLFVHNIFFGGNGDDGENFLKKSGKLFLVFLFEDGIEMRKRFSVDILWKEMNYFLVKWEQN